MSYDCFCDFDPAQVYSVRLPRARKEYRCEECKGKIRVSEQYERVFAVWDNWPSTIRTCERCRDLRVWVKNNVPCLCWSHGNADQDMADAIDEAVSRAHEETVGLRFGFLRRKEARDRHNLEPVRK